MATCGDLGGSSPNQKLLIQIKTTTEKQTTDAGRAFASVLRAGDIVALYGDLGAGKTAFVRGAAAALGYAGRVTSPTFAIVNEYAGQLPVFHFDAYRLGSAEELYDIGWDDYIERGGVCFVEWAENVSAAFPAGSYAIRIEKTESGREITISATSAQAHSELQQGGSHEDSRH